MDDLQRFSEVGAATGHLLEMGGEQSVIRKAVTADLDGIEDTYREHFSHEKAHGAYTVFREGVYPTRRDAQRALDNGTLYVCVEEGSVLGSIILDARQPDEYGSIDWPSRAAGDRVRVIHLLMIRPASAGRGIGSALVNFALETARRQGCEAVRLDTGAQNSPAASLYKKLGFQLAAVSSMRVGGEIAHREHLFFEKMLGP